MIVYEKLDSRGLKAFKNKKKPEQVWKYEELSKKGNGID